MKKLCFFIFSAVMIFNLSAKEHNFSIGASFGMLNGRAQEIVYMDSETDNKLSELLWDLKPLPYIGLDIKYSWLKPENKWGLFANGLIKFGLPGKTGVMEDRDWLAENIGIDNPNWLTHYSVHDNKTESAMLMDFNLGVSFLIFQKFLLKPYISYHYMHFSWTASGGSILHPTWGSGYREHKYNPEDINVVIYEQTWHIFSPAISFYGEFNRFFDIEIAFEATPLIWCTAEDGHLSGNTVRTIYTDYVKGGIFIEPSLLFSYKPTEHFVLSLSFTYRDINKSRGDTLIKNKSSSVSTIEKNTGGAGYKAADFGIIAKFKF